jgi:hypothetical protein
MTGELLLPIERAWPVLPRSTDTSKLGDSSSIPHRQETETVQPTILEGLREAYGPEEGDERRRENPDDGIEVRNPTISPGRGILVDEHVPGNDREEMPDAMAAEIRAKRRTEWSAERRGPPSIGYRHSTSTSTPDSQPTCRSRTNRTSNVSGVSVPGATGST